MAMYLCQRCNQEAPWLSSDMCGPCLRELESLKPGDRVKYRHGKGWARGTYIDKYYVDSYKIRTASGKQIIRRDIYRDDTSR